VVERGGVSLGVVNLSGNLFLQAGSPALVAIDEALREVADADHVLVDMHAEATSEKVALGWHLDGRVTAVVGTHTHVPTADARVLPGGTAYITDVGMTGARGGVIGVKREQSIAMMRTHMPIRFDAADDDPWLNAVLVRASAARRADSIEPVLRAL
jgi:calcineurin-like phosphoesterase